MSCWLTPLMSMWRETVWITLNQSWRNFPGRKQSVCQASGNVLGWYSAKLLKEFWSTGSLQDNLLIWNRSLSVHKYFLKKGSAPSLSVTYMHCFYATATSYWFIGLEICIDPIHMCFLHLQDHARWGEWDGEHKEEPCNRANDCGWLWSAAGHQSDFC